MAGVSTPTISRFENGEEDIQLSSVVNILTVLGMIDHRHLIFPEPKEHVNVNRTIVQFTGRDRDKVIHCAITKEALVDHFDGDNQFPLKIFQANKETIEHEARRKYLIGNIENDGSILIKIEDLG